MHQTRQEIGADTLVFCSEIISFWSKLNFKPYIGLFQIKLKSLRLLQIKPYSFFFFFNFKSNPKNI